MTDDFFAGRAFATLMATARRRRHHHGSILYGGSEPQDRTAGTVVPWSALDAASWWEDASFGRSA